MTRAEITDPDEEFRGTAPKVRHFHLLSFSLMFSPVQKNCPKRRIICLAHDHFRSSRAGPFPELRRQGHMRGGIQRVGLSHPGGRGMLDAAAYACTSQLCTFPSRATPARLRQHASPAMAPTHAAPDGARAGRPRRSRSATRSRRRTRRGTPGQTCPSTSEAAALSQRPGRQARGRALARSRPLLLARPPPHPPPSRLVCHCRRRRRRGRPHRRAASDTPPPRCMGPLPSLDWGGAPCRGTAGGRGRRVGAGCGAESRSRRAARAVTDDRLTVTSGRPTLRRVGRQDRLGSTRTDSDQSEAQRRPSHRAGRGYRDPGPGWLIRDPEWQLSQPAPEWRRARLAGRARRSQPAGRARSRFPEGGPA